MRTLLLDRGNWDLTRDAGGNIAIASEPYSVAQDVSSAARLFRGECWYDKSRGVPYLQQVLARQPPLALVKSLLAKAALTVPLAAAAQVFIERVQGRTLIGQIQTRLKTGGGVIVVQATWPPKS